MTSECSCLTQEKTFFVYKKNTKWYHSLPNPYFNSAIEIRTITIHGDILKDIDEKINVIKKELQEKWGNNYEVF